LLDLGYGRQWICALIKSQTWIGGTIAHTEGRGTPSRLKTTDFSMTTPVKFNLPFSYKTIDIFGRKT